MRAEDGKQEIYLARDVFTVVSADHHSHKITTATTLQPLQINFDIHKIRLYNGFLHSTICLARQATTILTLGASLKFSISRCMDIVEVIAFPTPNVRTTLLLNEKQFA